MGKASTGIIIGIGCALAMCALPSAVNAEAVTIEFKSDFGPLTIKVSDDNGSVTGTYPKYQGVISGKVVGKDIVGYWMQPSGEKACPIALGNTKFWGRIVFKEPDANNMMAGKWSYCDGQPTAVWNATVTKIK